MTYQIRTVGWIVVAITLALTPSIRAVTNWASPEALGNVLVSSDSQIGVFGHDGGAAMETINVALPPGISITGSALDVGLNLLVATGAGTVLRIDRATHTQSPVVENLPAVPGSIVPDADGNLYIGFAGSPATVLKFGFNQADGTFGQSAIYSVSCDASVGLWLDLAPRRPATLADPFERQFMFYDCGGREIRYFDVLSSNPGSTLFVSLPNPGSARDFRLLPPKAGVDAVHGGVVVADTRNVKWLTETGAVIRTFDVPDGPESANTWCCVDFSPIAGSFWAAQSSLSSAYRFVLTTNPAQQQPAATTVMSSTSPISTLAVNGGYRSAFSTRLLTRGPTADGAPAVFLPKTDWDGSDWQNSWDVCPATEAGCGTFSGDVRIAVTFHEARSGRVEPAATIPADLNLDQRLAASPSTKPIYAYRNRGAFIRAVQLSGDDISAVQTLVTMDYIGQPAVGNNVTILLDDPDPVPHVGFRLADGTLSTFTANIRQEFFQTHETLRGGTSGLNDFLIATAPAQFATAITAPTGVKTYQLSNPVPIRVKVGTGIDVCANMVLTVARQTTPPTSILVGSSLTTLTDSRGIRTVFTFDARSGNCQANVLLNPNISELYPAQTDFNAGGTYNFCVNFRTGQPGQPLTFGDACGTFKTAAAK